MLSTSILQNALVSKPTATTPKKKAGAIVASPQNGSGSIFEKGAAKLNPPQAEPSSVWNTPQKATANAAALKSSMEASKAATTPAAAATPAAVPTPAATAADDGLRDAYKAVFGQQSAQVERQNALRSSAARRTAAETAGIGGYNPAQAARAQELADAGANAANVENTQNLLSTGTDLAQAQQNADDAKLTALVSQFGEDSPEFLAAYTRGVVSGVPADYSNVFETSADGTMTVKTLSAAEKQAATANDYAAVLNDPNTDPTAKALMQGWYDSNYASGTASSATASTQNVATAIKGGADISGYTDLQLANAVQADASAKNALLSQAVPANTRADVGNIVNVGGSPMRITGKPYRSGGDADSYSYKAEVYDFATGQNKVVTLYTKDSTAVGEVTDFLGLGSN